MAAGLILGLSTGCASKPSAPVTTDELPPLSNDKPASPLTSEGDPQNQRAVVESVQETSDRFDQIIRQREQANRNAADLRETRQAAEDAKLADAGKAAGSKAEQPDDPSTIEKLAAKLRERQPIDPISEPTRQPEPTASAANAPLDPNAPPSDASEPASGAISQQTQINRVGAPNLSPRASADAWIAIQQKYSNRVAEDPRDLSAQLDLQLSRFLHDEPVPTMSDLAALPAEDRELLAAVCDALSNFRSVVQTEGNPLSSVKARPFLEMADRIRARSDLTLSGLTLCKKVHSFGSYDEIKPLQFDAGVVNRCVVYCEVDGFISQLNADQQWETKLSLELKLFDEHGLQVWNVPADPTTDLATRRRRDFCLAKIITLPANLAAGTYMLKAQVRDLLGNRVNEQTIQFAVKGGIAPATDKPANPAPAEPPNTPAKKTSIFSDKVIGDGTSRADETRQEASQSKESVNR